MSSEYEFLMKEAERATELLRGKEVSSIWRYGKGEVGIEFSDGTRLIVDVAQDGVEISITAGKEKDS